jgi:hypothetical protein
MEERDRIEKLAGNYRLNGRFVEKGVFMTFMLLLAKHKMEFDRVTNELVKAKEEIERLHKNTSSSSELHTTQGMMAVDEVYFVTCELYGWFY